MADAPPLHVLVAEDDLAQQMLLRHQLTRLGYRITLVADGEAAWEALQPGGVASDARLLVSDWMMPSLDGPSLCHRVRELLPGRPLFCLLLTARSENTTIEEALEAGADDVLSKLAPPGELALRLRLAERIVRLEGRVARLEAK